MINFPDAPVLDQTLVVGTSTWLWDGAKWVVSDIKESSGTILPNPDELIILTEAGPYYVNNSATLAALTIRLPLAAVIDDVVNISFRSPVTVLTIQDGGGAALTEPTSAYGPGAGLVFYYVDDVIKWVYWK